MLQRSISDGEFSKTVLKMLVRRLKEVGQERISSGSLAAGIKTISVWHRCLNSGNKGFLALSAQHAHLMEPPPGNALAAMYCTYVRELLMVFTTAKHAWHRDTVFEDSMVGRLDAPQAATVAPLLMNQMKVLLRCDL
eukprot:CAMPEP_0174941350 /NCGR_PEP_ID=MMETSP1355-20121228/71462_1 /TAXON_ID=464990 /ORGANISM="Hemiselmis tepida, Strain CCMP443" /LENGTH=136 /DNA_ID=CAMNT_0016188451 /DNA_START=63 /DNA_END=469 /DNA_ORIENTATION=+